MGGVPRKTLRRRQPHAALIDALGGPTAVAEALKVSTGAEVRPLTISMWRQRSVPHQYRPALVTIATARGRAQAIPLNFTLGA